MAVFHRRRIVRFLSLLVFFLASDPARGTDLVELFARARKFDPVFQAALYEKEIAGQNLKESRAGVGPALSANLQGSTTLQDIRRSNNVLILPGRRDFFSQTYSISLTQPIYRPELARRLPQARVEVRQAETRFVAAEQDLIFRLAQAYFNYLAAHDNLDFAVAERTAIGRQLAETEERLGSGLTTITDVHDARARFALAQASEIDAVDALEESRQAIVEITGGLPYDLKKLSEAFPLVEPDQPDVEVWVESALFQNPTIQALVAAVEIAERELRRQKGARLPTLDFVALYNIDNTGGSIFGGGEGSDIRTTDFELRLGIPIFDSGRVSALSRRAALRTQIAVQDLERQRRRVERETRAAFQGVLSGIGRVQALVKSVFSHEAALAAKEEGLRSGLNTGLDVLDARRDLFSARRDLAKARYVYVLNSLRLKQSAGVLTGQDLQRINAYLQ